MTKITSVTGVFASAVFLAAGWTLIFNDGKWYGVLFIALGLLRFWAVLKMIDAEPTP